MADMYQIAAFVSGLGVCVLLCLEIYRLRGQMKIADKQVQESLLEAQI